ncbi:hypothetical protein PROFUN_01046 [Planoprotostelium fungivorum]|uniref:Uncharacterized protein n=1 Tax=Planoprotostelium fungivorum TaxID=1890364 RepID=A0A2P6N4K4_9EUKA|nr:hypothetical protein PROFUN_01046 [Planoprotostelium fungivorum]
MRFDPVPLYLNNYGEDKLFDVVHYLIKCGGLIRQIVEMWGRSYIVQYDANTWAFERSILAPHSYGLDNRLIESSCQILYVGMKSGTNGPAILQIIDLTATYRSSDGVPVLISQVVLTNTPLS